MAITKGSQGKLVLGAATTGEVLDSTMTASPEFEDIRSIGDSYRRNLLLGKSWSITASCNYDPTAAGQSAIITAVMSTGTCYFSAAQHWEDASHYFGGSCYVTAATVRKSVGSPDKLELTVMSEGVWSYT
jgi:hypothetical protein